MWGISLLLSGCLALASGISVKPARDLNEVIDEEREAIVTEGDSFEEESRQGRTFNQAELIVNKLGLAPITAPTLGQPCFSKETGSLGKCMSLKECYPYFKLIALPQKDTWVMGSYDTCSYQSPKGKSVFGMCCNNTLPENLPKEKPSTQGDNKEDNEYNKVTADHEAIIDEFPLEFQLVAPGAPQCGARNIRPKPTLYDTVQTLSSESVTNQQVPAGAVKSGSVVVPADTTALHPSYSLHGIYPGGLGPVGTPLRPVDSPWARKFLYSPDFRIVNGVEAIAHEFPFMAALLNRNRQFCGGSLIDSKHILTAAHCVAHMSKYDVQNLRVRLGDHNIHQNSDNVEKRVKRVIRHKGFSSSTLWNDVAVLTLEDDVSFTDNIQPICLPKGSSSYLDNIVTVAGWGTLKEGGKQPSTLRKVDVKVWSNERCKTSYGSNAPGGITSHMMCASDTNRDSCSGDSGGPLFDCPWGGRCTQIGIVSWGIGCAKPQYPGVYTRVTEMHDWIQRIVDEY